MKKTAMIVAIVVAGFAAETSAAFAADADIPHRVRRAERPRVVEADLYNERVAPEPAVYCGYYALSHPLCATRGPAYLAGSAGLGVGILPLPSLSAR
jgi:hypothetical protein